MSFWRKKEVDFEEVKEVIQQHPGISIRELARRLGVAASTIVRRLPSLNDAGILLSEDDDGGLWPFDNKK
jgi:DNA-binding Lrp family transcriptional regulator